MKRLINWLFPKPAAPSVPRLRNKPGGLAYINLNNAPASYLGLGMEALHGRYVCTVRRSIGNSWEIDPPQRFVATCDFTFKNGIARAGEVPSLVTLDDAYLVPVDDLGLDESEVRDLYAPNTNKERTHV